MDTLRQVINAAFFKETECHGRCQETQFLPATPGRAQLRAGNVDNSTCAPCPRSCPSHLFILTQLGRKYQRIESRTQEKPLIFQKVRWPGLPPAPSAQPTWPSVRKHPPAHAGKPEHRLRLRITGAQAGPPASCSGPLNRNTLSSAALTSPDRHAEKAGALSPSPQSLGTASLEHLPLLLRTACPISLPPARPPQLRASPQRTVFLLVAEEPRYP